jgi:thioesterase domain-containing protein
MPEFLDLSRALGPGQPFFQLDIFALQRQKLFIDEPLYTSVCDLAVRFKQDILSIQPAGPYFLGGMCEGGIVALEIALQLQEEGLEVALLAEFDTPVNGYWRKRSIDWLKHGWSLILSRRLVSRLHDHIRPRTTTSMHGIPQEETYALITSITWEAIRTYSPRRVFEGEIQLFRAPRPAKSFREDAIAGWHGRASRGIRVHDVVGDHLEIFREPLSQQIIASVIQQAQHDLVAK